MRFGDLSIPKEKRACWGAAARYGLGGFLLTLGTFEGRAPLGIAFLAAARGQVEMMSALCGSVAGAFFIMDFSPGLRYCGILVLIYSVCAAFRDTPYIEQEWFRPVAAAGMTAVTEFAYLLQVEFRGLFPYLAYVSLTGLLCHYLSLLMTRRQKQPHHENTIQQLRRRLELSAAAFRDLYNSFGRATSSRNEENPAVVFDRAAEATCRGCRLCALCWDREYISTFNALNDATPQMMERGKSLPEDYPEHFRSRCLNLPQFLAAVNQELGSLLLRRQYARRLDAERQRTVGQFAQLSEFLGQTARQAEDDTRPSTAEASVYQVGSACRPREGEGVCGDCFSWFETDRGLLYLLISDGMGSGEEARKEASTALRLMEQFLRAGIEPEPALKTINAALTLRNEEAGTFTTLDLLEVNLSSREAALYKYGAAPTYIKRHGGVRRITGTALPVGLQEIQSVPVPTRFPLDSDVFLLMVSDGISDASGDDWLQNLLAGWQGGGPQRLVSVLMAESRKHGGLRDDCSALCLQLSRPPEISI